jgi:hypothetical protein
MSRSLPAALATEFGKDELELFYAVELGFSSQTLRFWTGYGDLSANGETWTGSGLVMAISNSQENTDLSANGLSLTFSGLDTTVISFVLTENYRGRVARVYVGALVNGTPTDLYQLWAGRMDVMSFVEDGTTATVQIQIENILIDLERPRIRLYTDEEQKALYPNDLSLSKVAGLQDRQIVWGRATEKASTSDDIGRLRRIRR